MDYHQVTERYKQRETKSRFYLLFGFILFCVILWLGWFWGYSQQGENVTFNNQEMLLLIDRNESLEQEKVALKASLENERAKRIQSDLLIDKGQDNVAMTDLSRLLAQFLSQGIEADQIRNRLKSLSRPVGCRVLRTQDLAVATSFFASEESSAIFLDGSLQAFVEGVVQQEATRERPWFDPKQSVSLRLAYLGGEKKIHGQLPLSAVIIADAWMLRLDLKNIPLRGYVNFTINKCNLS